MAVARILSSCAAVIAVAGCTAVAMSMGRAASSPDAVVTPYSMPTIATSDPAVASWPRRSAATTVTATGQHPRSTAHVAPTAASVPTTHAGAPRHPQPAAPTTSTPTTAATPAPNPVATPAPRRGQSLPVAGTTADSTRVITVSAASYASTTATLQAWDRAPGGGWLRRGPAILAHVGADGLSTSPSETRSATPVGSFTLTQAFGAYNDPGTALPYFTTNSADWWISEPGSLYNTHQHCASGCGFSPGDPNEHLASILPYYRYAVVIDYNRAPVVQGAGSAFFLHVTDGRATAGCVAIPQANLVSIMQWLTPSAHPRILIGIA